MQAAEQFATTVDIYDADGNGVTGLTSGDITFPCYVDGDSAGNLGIDTWTEIGGGKYKFEVTLDAENGYHQIFPTPDDATYEADPPVFEGEIEANDKDSIAALVVRQPVLSLGTNVPPFRDFTIRTYKGDYREVTIPILDDAGDAIDLSSGWNDAVFGVKSADQTTVSYSQSSGITLGNGTAIVAIPESASFYSALATGQSQVELWWSLEIDPDDDTKTRTVRSGKLIIHRKET